MLRVALAADLLQEVSLVLEEEGVFEYLVIVLLELALMEVVHI